MANVSVRLRDEELLQCLELEENRQHRDLEMIASESIQSAEALMLAGSAFNNKTALGRIGNQRLQGSEYADMLERLAAKRACEIFGAEHANMVTYSGSVANFSAYAAVLKPGDPVLALSPATGAHQTHGGRNNVSSAYYRFQYFGIKEDTQEIDYEGADRIAAKFHPKLLVIGSAAYPRNLDFARLADIAHRNEALLMVDVAHFTGLIAAGVSPNPVPYADIVTASTTKTMCGPHSGFVMCKAKYREQVERSIYPGNVSSFHLQTIAAMAYTLWNSQTPEFGELMRQIVRNAQYLCNALQDKGFGIFTGGTDCHMFLLDVKPFGLNGVEFANALNRVHINVNSKGIPFENTEVAGGVRAGTTVLTQRGMREAQMDEIAELFYIMASNKCSEAAIEQVRARVLQLSAAFPLP